MDKIRTIKLYGPLAKEFGHTHRFSVKNVVEATRALRAMIPGFEKFLMESKDRGLDFAIFVGGKNISQEELGNPVGDDEIRIVPIVRGSKKGGLLQIIAGVVLIVAGYFVTGLSYGWAAPLGNAMIGYGIGMIVGGVIQMLSPPPKKSDSDAKDDKTSYTFNGAVNVTSQGASVPVLYGCLIVGSVVVSAGISAQDNYVVPSRGDYHEDGEYGGGGSMMGDVIYRITHEY